MLNLIEDPWIPVQRNGGPDVIRPDQIADLDVLTLNWPRPDLNLACCEFLIGLTYLAAPPADEDARDCPPGAAALRAAMAPLAPAFNLVGDGPRFLQDFTPLEGTPNAPDMLFIDSAGEASARKNADLMVHRKRYGELDLPLAAMALYTLQAFAPAGGAGNRTSMRGGGPMVTLVRPAGAGLWPLIWANVPEGAPLDDLTRLPWMRPTNTSEKGRPPCVPGDGNAISPEMFFGQPRRLRLVAEGGKITGVVQRPYGTNYEGWQHALSPYYLDAKGQFLPVHPKPGPFGYRNWRGVIFQSDKGRRPACLETYLAAYPGAEVRMIVGGWAMDNMKPLDFLWSEQPVFPLSPEAEMAALSLVEAAEQAGYALAVNTRDGMGEADTNAGAGQAARLAFFDRTQVPFEQALARLSGGAAPDPRGWLTVLQGVALEEFDRRVLPGLSELSETRRQRAVAARKSLLASFSGHGGMAKKIFAALNLELPPKQKRTKETA